MKDMLIERALKSLAIVALILVIICSLSWLMERPNRYQFMVTGGFAGGKAMIGVRTDTCTGRMEYVVMRDLTIYKETE